MTTTKQATIEMAAVSKESLFSYLQGLGITVQTYDHPVVMTVEEQAKYIGHLNGGHSKNLFLKDKKSRLYLICALTSTNVDLKVLSQRLGLGKGGLRMAPEETLQTVLKVPLGSVTPFALMNASAGSVALLLDKHFKECQRIFFHPLSNDSTIALTHAGLDTFLRSIGREPPYMDLEEIVAVGKDQPPDLALYVPSVADQDGEELRDGTKQMPTGLEDITRPMESAGSTSQVSKAKQKVVIKERASAGSEKFRTILEDPQKLASYILDKTIATVLEEVKFKIEDLSGKDLASTVSAKVREQLAPDLQNVITMFKNTAYTEGFTSAFGTRCRPS